MKQFTLYNRITAAAIFLIAFVLYLLTMSPTVSFWDCGEFIAASRSLSVPHPPGAPFFLLVGRLFTLFPFIADMGARVNLLSVVTSALTVALLYLTVIHLIRQWKPIEKMGLVEILGAAVGALVFMASDSFWFNAVEAEVYAISMLFTALVVWLAFVWQDFEARGHHDGDRIFLLIFYIIGLAIGVHLLNVLALPMVFMVIWFHRSQSPTKNMNRFLLIWGACVLSILPIYPGVVLWLPKLVAAGGSSGDILLLALLLGLVGVFIYGLRKGNRTLSLASAAMLLVLLGYLSYILILVRSGLNPPLDENDPQTIKGLIAYLSREQYGSESITDQLLKRKAPFWSYQIQYMYLRYLGWQFIGHDALTGAVKVAQLWGLPMLVGLWGVVHHFNRDWKRAFTLTNLFLLTGLAIVVYLNQNDPQPRERDYSYVGSFYAFALWIGVGAAALLEDLSRVVGKYRRFLVPAAAVILLLALPVRMVYANYFTHDRSGNYVAWDYARNSLAMLEPNAILFTNGDNDTFPLWYMQIVEGFRTDVRVVNLSLLNTGWYARQLRDAEPTVPLPSDFTNDDFIAQALDGTDRVAFAWRYWGPESWRDRDGKPLPRENWYKVPFADADGNRYSVTVEPTVFINLGDGGNGNNFLRVQDRMILEILRANKWQRPIYFAVTVAQNSFVGFRSNLRMDGLAYRVMDRPQRQQIADQVLDENLSLFEQNMRGLDDASVYFDDNIQKLVQNYRSAYVQLALERNDRGDKAGALDLLQRMDKYLPESVVPPFNLQLSLQLGALFYRLGDEDALRSRLEAAPSYEGGLSLDDRFMLASTWLDPMKDLDRALQILEPLARMEPGGQMAFDVALTLDQAGYTDQAIARYKAVLSENPEFQNAVAALVRSYESQNQYAEAVVVLEDWLKRHPEDPTAQRRLENYRERARAAEVEAGEAAGSGE